jgi:hypothetical protein
MDIAPYDSPVSIIIETTYVPMDVISEWSVTRGWLVGISNLVETNAGIVDMDTVTILLHVTSALESGFTTEKGINYESVRPQGVTFAVGEAACNKGDTAVAFVANSEVGEYIPVVVMSIRRKLAS